MERLKIAVLISGRGSNLQALMDAATDPRCPFEIALVISNRGDAYGIERAFARVRAVGDWLKPRTASKDWCSKVDWAAAERVEPNLTKPVGFFMAEEQAAEKGAMEHDALIGKARAKASEYAPKIVDRINVHN